MKKTLLLLALLATSSPFAQNVTVTDNLDWFTTISTVAQSPDFDFCDSTINYTIATSAGNPFAAYDASGYVAPSWTVGINGGIVLPSNYNTNTNTSITVTITFSQNIDNLRLKIVDLDAQTNGNTETISAISPPFQSLDVTSTFFASGPVGPNFTIVTPQDPGNPANRIDNSQGWIEWVGLTPTNTFSFNYNRLPQFGIGIEVLEFKCEGICSCASNVELISNTSPDATGGQDTEISLNSNGELITQLIIDLPYYVSLSNNECLKCDNENVESFGTILNSSTISGVSGILYDPMGIGFGRKVIYNFPVPVVINETVDLILKFPPILDLSCCKNEVGYCLDITMKKVDCSVCENTICNNRIEQEANKAKPELKSTTANQDKAGLSFVNELNVKISPNPTRGNFEIEISDDRFSEGEIYIYDVKGNVIESHSMVSRNYVVNIENQSKGTYYLKIVSSEGLITTRSVVLN